MKISSLNKGLIGHWKFNGNARDNTPYNNNGTVVGATLTTDHYNGSNNAYSFNGTSAYIDVPYSSILAPVNQITCSAWAYRSNWSIISGNTRILSKTEIGGWHLSLDDVGAGNGYFAFFVMKSGTGYLYAKSLYTGLSTGWHHFTGTFDGRYARLYIDGVLKDTFDSTTTNIIGYSNNNSLIIGAEAGPSSGSVGNYFNGKIDDVRIYNRALTATEVSQLYNTYGGDYLC